VIDSYPSSIAYLAEVARDCGIASAQPRAVITSSETLTDSQRAAITEAFRTRVFDQYGSAEQVSFISQCEAGSYHVHPEYGITEFVPIDHAPSGARAIVATGFTNYAMPLLRYRTGDLATPTTGRCECGRAFPMVEHIVGRMDDLLVTPQGRRVGRLDPIFKGLQCVRRAQIVQDARDHVLVRIVPGAGFDDEATRSIRHELAKRLGDDVAIGFQVVDELAPGAGGKVRAVVSMVP
jgi:phenylacetate-CoA ligase